MDADAPLDAVRRELRLLRYFVAVAEELHVGRAARRLHMTQPPLTQAVRRLERDLGVELLARDGRGIRLTDAGARFALRARALVEGLDAAIAEAQGAAPPLRVRVAVSAEAVSGAWPRLAEAARATLPAGAVLVASGTLVDDALDDVVAGRVDAALSCGVGDVTELRCETVEHVAWVVVLGREHPLAAQPRVELAALRDELWLTSPGALSPRWRAMCLRLLRERGVPAPRTAEVLHAEGDVRRLRDGGAHLTLATFADVVEEEALVVRPLLPSASDAVCLLTRPDADGPGVAALREGARRVAAAPPA